jgi:dihydrofolate reductase
MKQDPGTTELPSPHTPHPVQTGGVHVTSRGEWNRPMRKIVAITQVTVDGVMQSPGGPEEDQRSGFSLGGWAMPHVDDDVMRIVNETVAVEFDLLLGRRTYDVFAAYWPKQGDNPVTNGYNKATKYVVTSSPERLDWKVSKRIGGDVAGEVRRLKGMNGPELHLWGSHQLLQTLIPADLIDEFRIWVFPLVVGSGKRLFELGVPPRGLSLVDTRRSTSGVLLNTYRPAGPIKVGSF